MMDIINSNDSKEIEINFLDSFGRTKLRPGGKIGTDWLIQNGDFSKASKVLEVSCSVATTAIHIAKKYKCHVTAVDTDENILKIAKANIKQEKLSDLITLQQASALNLPFKDHSFDVVINESMLTILPFEYKIKAIAEYYRVLKPYGLLLTHDLLILNKPQKALITNELEEILKIPSEPLTKKEWQKLFKDEGFRNIDIYTGDLSLLSLSGLIYDEGIINSMKILKNSLKKENINNFRKIRKLIDSKEKELEFIAVCSQK